MTLPARVAALVAVGALILGGVAVVGSGRGLDGPSPSPTPPPSVAAVVPTSSPRGLPVLDTQFMSPRNGFNVWYPAGWTVQPATQSWYHGKETRWGDPALDTIQTSDARFVGAGQQLAAGETADQWLKAYCLAAANGAGTCDSVPQSWEPIKIAGNDAYIDLDGVAAWPGTITPGGTIFDAVVVSENTAWAFTLDGDVDRPMFDAFLKKVYLLPASLIALPELTGTFTSPLYGYSIGTRPDWTATPATRRWTSTVPDSGFMDGFDVTADTSVGVMSQPLGSRTFDEFLAAFYQRQHETLAGSGCDDGGEPSTWPTIAIGDQTGRLEDVCSSASDEALVAVDGRVYLFELGHSNRGFPLTAFKQLLTTVTFDPANAKN